MARQPNHRLRNKINTHTHLRYLQNVRDFIYIEHLNAKYYELCYLMY